MFKRISQITLLLTVLFAVLGNTVKLGVCPCHQGVFFGDCECNLQVYVEPDAVHSSTCDCCSDHLAVRPPAGQGDQAALSHQGHCDNLVLKETAAFVPAPSLKAPDQTPVPLPLFVPFESDSLLLAITSGYESDNRLRPPPDLFCDTRLLFTGFMRPERA